MMFSDAKEAAALARWAAGLQGAFADPQETGRRMAELASMLAKVAAADAELHELRKAAAAKSAADANELMQLKISIEQSRQENAARLEVREKEIVTREQAVAAHEDLLQKQAAVLDRHEADLAADMQEHERRRAVIHAALGGQ